MENENLKPIEKLTPFTKMIMTIGTLPSSFYASMSYYESMVWLYEYLKNQVIPTVNNNAQAVEELQEKYIILQDNFNNLETWVHEYEETQLPIEVQNKLDEMAEDGTITSMIEEYLNKNAQLLFDTITDMKNSQILTNGAFTKTYGYYEINDGGSANYKIRLKTEEDIINEKTLISLYNEELVAELIMENTINIKQLGAKGDNETDETELFNFAQNLGKAIYVPEGNYILNNFEFNKSIEWTFKRSSSHPWFEGTDKATIFTSTGLTVSKGPKINNLIIKYTGPEQNVANRPIGLKLKSHFCEINGLHVSYFYIGIAMGIQAGGNIDYTRIYNAYSWYNYYCALYLNGNADNQINFVSLYDCNLGSSGVSPHDGTVEPDTTRGYGIYSGTNNAVYISNADLSSNETCSIYIDNANRSQQTNGLTISTCYAEENKYCDIYYKNGSNSTATMTNLKIENAFFSNSRNTTYYKGQVYIEKPFIAPNCKFMNYPHFEMKDKSCLIEDILNYGGKIVCPKKAQNIGIILKKNSHYQVSVKVMPKETGNIVLQNRYNKCLFIKLPTGGGSGFVNETQISNQTAISIPCTIDVENSFTIFLTTPDSDSNFVFYDALGYGIDNEVLDIKIEEIPFQAINTTRNTPIEGSIKLTGSTAQIYLDGAWKTITTS